MEPICAGIGIAGTVGSIIGVIAKSITALYRLRQQFKEANSNIILLIGQLKTVNTALDQVELWATECLAPNQQHQRLLDGLNDALHHCKHLVDHIASQISQLEWDSVRSLRVDSKVVVILEDQNIKDYMTRLNHQISALGLCLTAFRWWAISSFLRNKRLTSLVDHPKNKYNYSKEETVEES